VIPLVTARDDWWHRKYEEDEEGRPVLRKRSAEAERTETTAALEPAVGGRTTAEVGDDNAATTEAAEADAHAASTSADGHDEPGGHDAGHEDAHDEHEEHIHMPSPSYWPLLAAMGFPMIAYGLIYRFLPVCILGGVWLIGSLYAWALEPATAPDEPESELAASTALEPVSQAAE
jgi:cytochrome c oxidase subunit 1